MNYYFINITLQAELILARHKRVELSDILGDLLTFTQSLKVQSKQFFFFFKQKQFKIHSQY